jgi:hypothetical protein
MEEQMSNATVEEIVEDAKQPGKFNIIAALKERAYPTDVVDVYLDEQTAYIASKVEDEIDELQKEESAGGFILDAEKAKKLETLKENRKNLLSELNKSKFKFTLKGISEGKRDELLELAESKHPKEFEEEKNPFTGEVTKTEINNIKLNRLFTDLLWASHITQITAPDGSMQEGISQEDVKELRGMLPLSAIGGITEAIEKIRISTAVFMIKVDEDFLAKS